MSSALTDYFLALERLKKGQPQVVPKGTKITNDAVSLEAGRGKGTIKKSRAIFADLIKAIEEAAAERPDPQTALKGRLEASRGAAEKYRRLWEEALAREASLLMELYEAKRTIATLTAGAVFPIRGARP
ncbi:hypothetical protein [Cupriavidus taiwanensis]|uniref:Uncharacterized protein n=1 Tax=Cupriavidus taiwanensis TaxID=164546 RepID=A0A7Z7NPI7_9BURK|nr:hypothetical protein [Cupriavidus taiwanensis]SOZ16390.1 conserved hypothetical protein [Cupriavidus taiwanensis]SOZ95296.1 conserved hypothetical protein [Cupriavidus taiwanensis]SPC25213.1 conserved hypothetical protein [Cupriavidus taiwanensis]SPD37788.1 conserved protein of unknown function [Cupriavidus taiwanensis]